MTQAHTGSAKPSRLVARRLMSWSGGVLLLGALVLGASGLVGSAAEEARAIPPPALDETPGQTTGAPEVSSRPL